MKANKIFSLKIISIFMAICCFAFANTESFADDSMRIENKSSQFGNVYSSVSEGADDNAFAEQIRKQRNAFDISESSRMVTQQQQSALASGRNACDVGLRECMMAKCGNDFTNCALDGDTIFGDKLNSCRLKLTCTGEEFRLFTTEIKADRDLNVKLSSYTKVIECGNNYNKCLVEECGDTYSKCLGKNASTRAMDKCSKIAKQCTEQDSGLASRFSTVIGKLRETAEKDVKADEQRMYAIRDSMRSVCSRIGAMFDERSFDCVFTVNFFAGKDQSTPTASRKRYAGDTFVCLQEWFGINATTYKENAFRETRSQTAASSAMLGSGVGMAAGLISSGAIDRAIETQKAKKELKKEQREQRKEERAEKRAEKAANKANAKEGKVRDGVDGSNGLEGAKGDGDGDGIDDSSAKNELSEEERKQEARKQADFEVAMENGHTYGTKNADDYATTKGVLNNITKDKPLSEKEKAAADALDDDLKKKGDALNLSLEPEEEDAENEALIKQAAEKAKKSQAQKKEKINVDAAKKAQSQPANREQAKKLEKMKKQQAKADSKAQKQQAKAEAKANKPAKEKPSKPAKGGIGSNKGGAGGGAAAGGAGGGAAGGGATK